MELIHHMTMEIDFFRHDPISVQMVHNTDDDSLCLLIIKDLNTFKIDDFSLAKLNSRNRFLLTERFGASNQSLVINKMTVFLSLEFRGMLRELMLGGLLEQERVELTT
jgi:hypothetical protein